MRVGILGSGVVGETLAAGFAGQGHEVRIGSRSPEKLAKFAKEHEGIEAVTFAGAGEFGEVLVLAVRGEVASEALLMAGADNLAGKVVMDATNPIADKPPVNGVLRFFTDLNESLMEKLQKEFPEAKFVKAFNSVGAGKMVNPEFAGGRPTMFICGSDAGAKKTVSGILDQFGWDTADMGAVEAARAIEPLCMLWCIRGFAQNEWGHAFKLLVE